MSVVAKNDIGDLERVRKLIQVCSRYEPKYSVEESFVEIDAGPWDHCDDELPIQRISPSFANEKYQAYQQLIMRKTSAAPPSIA